VEGHIVTAKPTSAKAPIWLGKVHNTWQEAFKSFRQKEELPAICYEPYGVEMKRALERHQANEGCVIPILLRPVEWRGAPFEHLQTLPTNARPITMWSNQDEAWVDVAQGIRMALEGLLGNKGKQEAPALQSRKTVQAQKKGRSLSCYVERSLSLCRLFYGA
jgi:hypothetical protein